MSLTSVFTGSSIALDTLHNSGGTYLVQAGSNGSVIVENADIREGYMVALDGFERIVTALSFDDRIIGEFIGENWDRLTEPQNYLGTWVTNGRVYLDVAQNIYNIDSAVQVALNNGQLAIYDVKAGKSIDLLS